MTNGSTGTHGSERTTWVVICAGQDGNPHPEFIEGTQLVCDGNSGPLTVLDGEAVVRAYPPGAWTKYAEWVTSTGIFNGEVIRHAGTGSSHGGPATGTNGPAAIPASRPATSPLTPLQPLRTH